MINFNPHFGNLTIWSKTAPRDDGKHRLVGALHGQALLNYGQSTPVTTIPKQRPGRTG